MRLVLVLALSVALAGCAGTSESRESGDASATAATGAEAGSTASSDAQLPQGGEPYPLDPADFVPVIDNPYSPMTPGSSWVYREVDPDGTEQRVEVTVTGDTRVVQGVTATVVHDVVTRDGELVEDTLDWYAQDRAGNVWYLGEETAEYEGGAVVSRAGSWEAGVDGALAGIAIPADPQVGMRYRQEYYAGEAEDAGEVLSTGERVEVPFGSYTDVLMTRDTTPLQPEVVEHKFYAKGVGPVLALGISGGAGREELVAYTPGG